MEIEFKEHLAPMKSPYELCTTSLIIFKKSKDKKANSDISHHQTVPPIFRTFIFFAKEVFLHLSHKQLFQTTVWIFAPT